MGWFAWTALIDGNVLSASDLNTPLSNASNGIVGVANGALGTTTSVSGGIPYGSSSSTAAWSSALTANGVVYGGGAGVSPGSTAAGTTGQFLIATTSAAPSWSSTLSMEDSRTNTVVYPLTVTATTSGSPAAGIGTGIKLRAESGDENPSDLVTIEGAFSDVNSGSEDSYVQFLQRVAGAALTAVYRFVATGAFLGTFTHANSANRTYTLPNKDGTLAIDAQPSARVYNSAAQTITTGTETTITFNSERYDTDTIHDTGSDTGRLTCKTAGKYLIIANIQWESEGSASGFRETKIRLNGTTGIARVLQDGATNSREIAQNPSAIYDLAVNDYVEVRVTHSQGADTDVVANLNMSPEFMMTRISA